MIFLIEGDHKPPVSGHCVIGDKIANKVSKKGQVFPCHIPKVKLR